MSSKHGNERLLKSTSGYNYEANSGTSQFLLEEATEDEYEAWLACVATFFTKNAICPCSLAVTKNLGCSCFGQMKGPIPRILAFLHRVQALTHELPQGALDVYKWRENDGERPNLTPSTGSKQRPPPCSSWS